MESSDGQSAAYASLPMQSAQARVDELLDSLPDTISSSRRIHLLQEAARLYEEDLGDPDAALVVLQAALRENFQYEPVIASIERLATETRGWASLLADLVAEAKERAADEPEVASRLWVRIASWLSHPLGDLDKARRALGSALRLDGDNALGLELLVDLLHQEKDWPRLVEALERLSRLQVEPAKALEWRLWAAQVAEHHLQNIDKATLAYQAALDLDPVCADALEALERIYRGSGSAADVVAVLKRRASATEDVSLRLELQLEMAHLWSSELGRPEDADRIYAAIEDPERAVAHLLAITERCRRGPEKAVLHYRVGRLLEGLGVLPDKAEWHYQEAFGLDAEYQPAAARLIEIYESRAEFGRMASLYEQQARRSQTRRVVAAALLKAARLQGDPLDNPSRALELCEQALEHVPGLRLVKEMLAELYYRLDRWTELAPIAETLLAELGDERGSSKEAALRRMIGRCSSERGEHAQAAAHLEVALAIEPGDLHSLKELAGCAFRAGEWERTVRCYEDLLRQHAGRLERAAKVEAKFRMAEAKRALGRSRAALDLYKEVLALEPRHTQARTAEVELRRDSGDFRSVAQAKRARLRTASDDERADLLLEIGELEAAELNNPDGAFLALKEALTLRPGDRALMQKLMDLAASLQRWSVVHELTLQFAQSEKSALRRGRYLLAAAEVCRDKLGKPDEAIAQFERALDAFYEDPEQIDEATRPRCLKAFHDLDALLTRKKAWKEQERAYRRMIMRVGTRSPLLPTLWRALTEIYSSRLRQPENALAALEALRNLQPEDLEVRRELAHRYVEFGVDGIDKAIAEHHAILRRDSQQYASYSTLAHLYQKTGRTDEAWSFCQALVILDRASPSEKQFFTQHRAMGAPRPRARITPGQWAELYHPAQDSRLSSLFALILPQLSSLRGKSLRAFGANAKKRVDLREQSNERLVLLERCARALSIEPGAIFVDPRQHMTVSVGIVSDKSSVFSTLVVGGEYLRIADEREAAFFAARQLCRLRLEHQILLLFPESGDLRAIVDWAFARVVGRIGGQHLQDELAELELSPQSIEQVQLVLGRLAADGNGVSITEWQRGCQLTMDRVGLLASGDLTTATRALAKDADDCPISARERVTEMLQFSISEPYFSVRRALRATSG